MAEIFFLEGTCPFLLCLMPVAHWHPVCETCGAIRYGNLFCATCRAHGPERRAELEENLERLRQLREEDPNG